jgi:uncharacterized protein (DUF433 family)
MSEEPKPVARLWISHEHAYGSPAIRGRALRADFIHARWLNGETEEELANDLDIDVRDVVAAIYFQLGRTRSKRALSTMKPIYKKIA